MLIRDADVAAPAPTAATVAYGAIRVVVASSTPTTTAPPVHTIDQNRENQRIVVLERQVAEKDACLAQKDEEIARLEAMVRALQLKSTTTLQTPTTSRRDPVTTSSPFSLSSTPSS
jgi:hypothetical protein